MNQVQILDDRYFAYNKKKVSFDDSVKTHDGASKFNSCFAKLCMMYFQPDLSVGKIDNSFEILNFLYMNELDSDDSFIFHCLKELELAKFKLLSDQKNYEKEDDDESTSFNKNDEEEKDLYWNNEFWKIRSDLVKRGKSQKKVHLTRKGNREVSIIIFPNHYNKLERFIDMIYELMEWHDLFTPMIKS